MERIGNPELALELVLGYQSDLRRQARIAGRRPLGRQGRVRAARVRIGRALVGAGLAIAGVGAVTGGRALSS